MSDRDEFCPECGHPLDWDEVDIGVGVQRGNYNCPSCGWVPRDRDQDDLDMNDFDGWPDPEEEIGHPGHPRNHGDH